MASNKSAIGSGIAFAVTHVPYPRLHFHPRNIAFGTLISAVSKA
jgi:hypothetical protein